MERGWTRFRSLVAGLEPVDLERRTSGGWTAKEMLGHMAFWEETVEPVIIAMFRGDRLAADWAFGSGYTHPNGPWPLASEHNAREAAWARERPTHAVLSRLDAAHTRAMEIVCSLSEAEVVDARYQEYLLGRIAHYDEHRPELEALLAQV